MTGTSDDRKIIRRLVEVVLKKQNDFHAIKNPPHGPISVDIEKLVDAVMEELRTIHA